MGKHTPGPWEYGITREGGLAIWADNEPDHDADALAIACDRPTRDETVDNARLIAAAPDLLAAAEAVLASLGWEEKRSGTTYAGSDKLRTAIAAARGEA